MPSGNTLTELIERAQARSAAVRARHAGILPPLTEPWHPIPFFGPIEAASALTVAMNPSAAEFRGRGWPASLPASALADRLVGYFSTDPHPWFGPSELPLLALGLRYGRNLAHVDLVCRATLTITKDHGPDFLALADAEADLFFATLELATNARAVILCGSITKARYAHVHVARNAAVHGWRFSPRPSRSQGGPFASIHELRSGSRVLPVLFASASVNHRDGPGHYQRLVLAHRDWLSACLGR